MKASILITGLTLAVLMSPVSAEAERVWLTTKAPYQAPAEGTALEAPPDGFRPLMVQHVARHGSRGLSSSDDEDLLYQLWKYARDRGQLTELGQQLGPELETMITVHARLGFGRISRLGEMEHEQQAQRLAGRLPALFQPAEDDQRVIRIIHSGRERAADSGVAFVNGLLEAAPGLGERIQPPEVSVSTVYFHSAEGSEDFEAYRDNDPQLTAAMARLYADPMTDAAYEGVMRALFTPDLIEALRAGELEFIARADEDERLNSIEDAVEALYGLYTISTNLVHEADFDLGRFLPAQYLGWIAMIDDADSYYGRGPGFAGRDITYRAADALFADMLAQAMADPPEVLATFRFTHAQVMMPVATWLRLQHALPGTEPERLNHYDTHAWRSAEIAPMSANLLWEIWHNEDDQRLVRMLHNETQVRFPAPCKSHSPNSYFYRLEEVRRCLQQLHPTLTVP
jgi:hypothetical protein